MKRCGYSRLSSVLGTRRMNFLRTISEVVQRHPQKTAEHREISEPLRRTFPEADYPRNMRIFRQSAIGFGIGNIVQHVDHARAIHARRIVHPCLLEVEVLAQLPGASLGEILHVVFAAEVQATGGTGFDAGGLKPLAHAVDAERALEHLLGGRIELGNIEGTAAHAVSAADTVLLLKVDDAIR